MFTISKRFDFSASHVLEGLPAGHQCGRLHGHNYAIELELAGEELGPEGFVLDYGAMAPFKTWLDNVLDHRHLNEIMHDNPTAEHLARLLWEQAWTLLAKGCPGAPWTISAVRVYETPKTCAEYRP